ncbi:PREDICTED: lipoamide acyltransferase component of branched-chain alpha-keto acid dehydrogenase complex, mitochondrial isoform X3 [Rhagoletis zephyria]|uniref:lipoamide acyltransferase component of branched-chain alpha-keto acid dehydrogenase complex, mitochondrial isoform X3 n=1 Tax=Rhagoletis zephyria TaxID=28612 RepID=UPI0008117F5A|nr:PREDICTED: lipoamide acyltransferase component of branched-chain alpha-keto acid dehydrogenase complex, mitochondrial isoform X3 [Rhagoletis zephyria]
MSSIFLKNGAAAMIKYSLKICWKSPNAAQIRYLNLTPCLQKLVTFRLSDIGEGIREVTVKEWFVKVGDSVEQFDEICEVQSDKASVTITSRYDGKIVKLYHPVDDVAHVGKPLLDFEVEEDDDSDSESSADSGSSASDHKSFQSSTGKVASDEDVARHITLATPAVRRLAMENKVDLSKVPPTGKQGRVLKGDVLEYLGHLPAGTNIQHPTIAAKIEEIKFLETKSVPKSTPAVPYRVEPLKGVPKAMLKTMSASLKIPHFAYSDEVNMTKLIDFRDQLKSAASDRGIPKLTFMPFCIKAASIALSKFPILNSSLDIDKEAVIYKASHNISVAIDSPQGLIVPNIKNCESKNILEIALHLNELVERGRKNALTPQDFADGTFSLSNIGVFGGTYTHPCIMAPQVAIGAMGRTKLNLSKQAQQSNIQSARHCDFLPD